MIKLKGGLCILGYTIDEYGTVYSEKSGKHLKLIDDGGGYYQVSFSVPKEVNPKCRVSRRVHLLVWENFVGEIPENMQINHIDGDKKNNNITNLEVVSSKDNSEHAVNICNRSNKRKLSMCDANRIRELYSSGTFTILELTEKFDVSYKSIQQILNYVTYKDTH